MRNPKPRTKQYADLRRDGYATALERMRDAQVAVNLWADMVSADAERRLGVTCDDPARYDDPAYAQALDMVGKARDALVALEAIGRSPEYAAPVDPHTAVVDAREAAAEHWLSDEHAEGTCKCRRPRDVAGQPLAFTGNPQQDIYISERPEAEA